MKQERNKSSKQMKIYLYFNYIVQFEWCGEGMAGRGLYGAAGLNRRTGSWVRLWDPIYLSRAAAAERLDTKNNIRPPTTLI